MREVVDLEQQPVAARDEEVKIEVSPFVVAEKVEVGGSGQNN